MMLKRILGEAFRELPEELREFHSAKPGARYHGLVSVSRGNWAARRLCDLGGFPGAGRDVPMGMRILATGDGEEWQRDFGGHSLSSRMHQYDARHVLERFGPFEVLMRPAVRDGGLDMPVVGLRCLGVPVPSRLIGRGGGRETVSPDGKIHFQVSSELPIVGSMIAYSGFLEPTG